jgi:hypothetical protein
MGGSPGAADPPPPPGAVLNEILAHTDVEAPPYDSNDRIELFNKSPAVVALDDYYLSDDKGDLRKWRISQGTVLESGAWVGFDEMTGFHSPITNGFGLDKAGEQVFLSHLPGNAEDRVVDAVRFDGQERDVSLGHYPDGSEWWMPMPPTPGVANAPPIRGAVIRAFMYHPRTLEAAATDDYLREYVEVFNPTTSPVAFVSEGGAWRLAGAVTCSLPADLTLLPGHSALVVPFDPADSNAMHAVVAEFGDTDRVQRVVGPWGGRLSDTGERLSLERPLLGDLPGDPLAWVVVDEAIYFHLDPWPAGADGTGAPLRRRIVGECGNNPMAWEPGRTQQLCRIVWPFDDGAGLTATDSSGGARGGTLVDAAPSNGDADTPPVWSAGRRNGGLLFDGVDDAVRYAPSPVTSFPFSVSAWIRTTNTAGATAVFMGSTSSDDFYFALGIIGGRAELASDMVSGSRGRMALVGSKTVADGSWHHVIGVFPSASLRALYVDGAPDGTLVYASTFPPYSLRFTAGLRDGVSFDRPWRGELDDVRLYGEELGADESRALFYDLPWERDVDVDGVPDAWQTAHFGGICVPGGAGGEDADGDGQCNADEYLAGTDPTNRASVLRLQIAATNGVVVAGCPTVAAVGAGYEGLRRYYTFQATSNMVEGVWDPIAGYTAVPGDDGVMLYTNDAAGPRFFSTSATLGR